MFNEGAEVMKDILFVMQTVTGLIGVLGVDNPSKLNIIMQ